MKIASIIAGALLGFVFVASGLVVLLNMVPPQPAPPEGSAVAHFMAAFEPTGYFKFVKILEIIGGLLIAIPKTRRAGMLILGPILVNILAFHALVAKQGVFSPALLVICALTLFLVYVEREAFASFVWKSSKTDSISREQSSSTVTQTI